METFLAYLLKSTICISILYLVFRWTLKRENLFALNRFLLLAILVSSVAIPLIKLPVLFHQTIDVKVFPEKNLIAMPNMDDVAMQITTIPTTQYASVPTERTVSVEQITTIIYAIGVLTLFVALLIALTKIGLLLINTKVYRKKNYNLALVNGTVSPMSFGKFIIMSKQDFKDHRKEILKHELAHIKFKHTYDLLLVELVKLFHWFNPLVYQLRNDLKEIQEFQVDRHLLRSGINSQEYQLLLIKKCVGTERYALANSFNHCQIKNRIVMMNNSKNSKGKSWKVAIFLPIVLLMLMAFGNNRSDIPLKSSTPVIVGIAQEKKIWTESDFEKVNEEALRNRREKDFFNNLARHNILMNRFSKIMMDGKVVEINVVKQQVQQLLDQSLSGIDTQNLDEKKSLLKFIIVIQKDIATNEAEYNNVLNIVGNSFSVAREKLANEKFNTGFESLNIENRKTIETIIPLVVYLLEPKQMSKKSETGPPPPPSTLKIKNDGIYLGQLVTLEELKRIIEYHSADDKMRFILDVEEGVTQGKIEEVKQALKNAEIVRIINSPKVSKTDPTQKTSSMAPQISIEIKTTGIYLNNELATLEEMKNKISKRVAKEPDIVIFVGAGIGVSDKQVNDLKSALREAGALHVNYSTDVKEKDYPKTNN